MQVSETSKYRDLTVPFCRGYGIDIGCGGDPVVPWAIAFDLPEEAFEKYHGGHVYGRNINYGGDALNLPFKDQTLDWVYSSHLLEDFADWMPALKEWARVLKVGGRMIVLMPDKALWKAALDRGQPPNDAHRHEATVGELSEHVRRLGGFDILEDRRTALHPDDYSILFIAVKTA